jgi:hypothetical protein
MDKFIYIEKSLSKEICDKIIQLFENEKDKKIGRMIGGIDLNFKNTLDFEIPAIESNWDDVLGVLQYELQLHINKYIEITKNIFGHNILKKYTCLFENCFNVQKYKANEGFYTYHNDFHIDIEQNNYRVLTFLWYLNDVNDGGETEMLTNILIKPQCGNLLLFPATWNFPHRGLMPLSNDKYIITGWLCSKIIE